MQTTQLYVKCLFTMLLIGLFGFTTHSQTVVEDFETGDFSFLDWQFEGTPNAWQIEEASLNGGVYAASANAVAFNDNVFMTVTRTFTEPGQVTFDVQQTEDNIFIFEIGDIFSLYTPGFIVGSGVRQETYDIPVGTYEIRFGSYNIGGVGEPFTMKDSVFIDNITFSEASQGDNKARVQVIHNSADAAAEVVDVWLNDSLLIDDFTFRTATPFTDVPAGEEFTISIKEADSTNPFNPLWSQDYTLEEDETYVLIANGIISTTGYFPAQPFDIHVFDMGREEASLPSNTDLLVFHGSTDTPPVDIYETSTTATEVVDDLSYQDFAGYLELDTDDYILEVRNETGVFAYAVYEAPLSTYELEGLAVTVVASGFFNPNINSAGASFGLWVAVPAGGDLIPLPLLTASSFVEKSFQGSLEFYPNPADESIFVTLDFAEATDVQLELIDRAGRIYQSLTLENQTSITNYPMDIRSMAEGVYFLRAKTKAGSKVEKVIITH
jgi:hypothetical protein